MQQTFYILSIDRLQHMPVILISPLLEECVRFLPYILMKPNGIKKDEAYGLPRLPILPEQVLQIIFKYLHPNMRHIIRLSMTCRRLWNVGWRHILSAVVGRWSGTRLFCEGSLNSAFNLPVGIITPEEARYFAPRGDPWDEDHVTLGSSIRARGTMADPHFWGGHHVLNLLTRPSCQLPEPDLDRARCVLSGVSPKFSEAFTGEHWTLRNLTKKVFIRGQRLNAAFHPHEPSSGLDLPSPGFGEALLSRITWSSYADWGLGWNKGEWAGDRFELVTDEEHARATGEDWTDETEGVIHTLATTMALRVHP